MSVTVEKMRQELARVLFQQTQLCKILVYQWFGSPSKAFHVLFVIKSIFFASFVDYIFRVSMVQQSPTGALRQTQLESNGVGYLVFVY
jgi:hypothetical protein